MALISTLLISVALAISLLALISYQWVSFAPQLGIATLYYLKQIRVGIAVLATLLALISWWLTPTTAYLLLLLLVLLLTPLSGFFSAGKVLVAVNQPRHASAAEAPLAADAPVLGTALDGRAHAWLVETLVPHHLVNDEIDRRPIVATW